MKILYLTREPYPTFRPDLRVLFGKYLPDYGIKTSLISREVDPETAPWEGGGELLHYKQRGPKIYAILQSIASEFLLTIKNIKNHDVLQVRDKVAISLLCLPIAKITRTPFYFWMSWPFPEDDIERVKVQGKAMAVPRRLCTFSRGLFLGFLQYRLIFSFADHIFVQSRAMKKWLTEKGVDPRKMTPVPMGVDLDEIRGTPPPPDLPLDNKEVIAYIGSLNRTRRVGILLDVLENLLRQNRDIHLLLIGGLPLGQDISWFQETVTRRKLDNRVTVTGWLAQKNAWSYLKTADLALNLLPRHPLFDTSTPTKILEYAALGIPCVVTDNPDQKEMIEKLQCGQWTTYNLAEITRTITVLLDKPELLQYYARNGRNNISRYRSYDVLSEKLARKYWDLQTVSPNHRRN